jgi:opacity protein-like surface antigen
MDCMRSFLAALAGTVVLTGIANAQPPATGQSPTINRIYVEGIAQAAFGNVTSESYGGEVGFTITPRLQVFVEAGQVRNAAPSDAGASAQVIAAWVSRTQSNVTSSVREPVTFGLGGLRFRFPLSTGKFEPYLAGGGGIARVTKDATFTVAGTDVTNSLNQFGVVLGSDLAGSETKPMLTVGGGVVWLAGQHLVVDFQYRYGRVFTSVQGLNVNRVGVGFGVRF